MAEPWCPLALHWTPRLETLAWSTVATTHRMRMRPDDGYTIDEFVDFVRERGKQGLCRDYLAIKALPPEGTFNASKHRANQAKNRYTDVLCLDHSRVPLQGGEGDYINANRVDGYKQRGAFISTQGPLPRTFEDFWRMVWEQNTLTIVMTTRTVERGRVKCGQYWPSEQGQADRYGAFSVTHEASKACKDYVVTTLTLQHCPEEESSTPAQSRTVHHFQFTSWPDYGVPTSAQAMLLFLHDVRAHQAALSGGSGGGPPIVVHCSAGIGRTGTFITLDICIQRLADVGRVSVEATVRQIRAQRAFSIQMPDQYVFCHLALIEHALMQGLLSDVDLTGFDDSDDESD